MSLHHKLYSCTAKTYSIPTFLGVQCDIITEIGREQKTESETLHDVNMEHNTVSDEEDFTEYEVDDEPADEDFEYETETESELEIDLDENR